MTIQSTQSPLSADIREVAPRDGLQIEKPISTDAKLELIKALLRAGVKRIEATAFVSPTAVPAMADAEFVADRVLALVPDYPQVAFSALVVNARGAERAIASGLNRLEYVVSAGDGHSRANSGRSTAEAIDAVADIAAMAHAANGECEVIVATAWDCPFDGAMPVERILQLCSRAVAAGADQLCLADTIGSAVPRRVIDLVDAVAAAVPGVPLGAHFHNTRGSGLANAWVALSRGVSMLDASAGGLGGCPFAPGASGNIATEELVYLLEHSGVETGINLDAMLIAAAYAQQTVGNSAGSNLLRAGGPVKPTNPRPDVVLPIAEGGRGHGA